jgi:hypothetical protein
MEELIELRQYIEAHNYDKALELVADLEEMSKEDKLNKIYSYGIVLLVHLIKQQAEKRSTRSWEFSIYNAVKEIQRVNRRRKAGGNYANEAELVDLLLDGFETAIRKAALEAFEGQYSDQELRAMVDPEHIQAQALELIQR